MSLTVTPHHQAQHLVVVIFFLGRLSSLSTRQLRDPLDLSYLSRADFVWQLGTFIERSFLLSRIALLPESSLFVSFELKLDSSK